MGPPHEGSIQWPITPWANALICKTKKYNTPTGIVITERQFQVGPIYYTEGMVRLYSKHWYLIREKLEGKEGPKTSKTASILN